VNLCSGVGQEIVYEQIGNSIQVRISGDPHLRRLALFLSVVALALAFVIAVVYIVGLSQDGGDIRSWLSLAAAVLVASSAVWLLAQIAFAKRTRK
jgi:hypothetical protein